MAFHEVRFPDNISRGARGGPERRTQSSNWLRATRNATPAGPTAAAAMMSPMASGAPMIWRRWWPSSRPATAACTAFATRIGPTTNLPCRRRRSPRPTSRSAPGPAACKPSSWRNATPPARRHGSGPSPNPSPEPSAWRWAWSSRCRAGPGHDDRRHHLHHRPCQWRHRPRWLRIRCAGALRQRHPRRDPRF
jgi:hypothetical protein